MNKSIEELKKIIKMKDAGPWQPSLFREQALEEWINKWVKEVKYEQAVINPVKLNIEIQELLKSHAMTQLMEQIQEESVEFNMSLNKIEAKTCILRRPRE